MNVKKQIKKIAAITASLAIAATTMVSAIAYDLSDYPAPFVEDGVFNGAIVVGANAATQDVLGAIDIAASLQAESKTGTESAGSTAVIVAGGKDFDEVVVGQTNHAYNIRLTDNDLDGFVDSTLDFQDDDYDYEDYISIANGAIDVVGSQADEDYANNLYAEVATPSEIGYYVTIEKTLDSTLVANNDNSDIEFKFLGKKVKVTSFPSATSMTIESSSEYFMTEGDKLTIEGHEVELRKVGASAVLVAVDGQILSVDADSTGGYDTETFDEANDFEVQVQSAFYIENALDNSATVKLGGSISDTVNDGESAELFGEPSDENDANWVWSIAANNGILTNPTVIGVELHIDRTGLDANEADERDAIAFGDSIDFPNGYASIGFDALSENSFTDITVEIDNDWDLADDLTPHVDSVTNGWGYRFSSNSDDDDFVVGTVDTAEVWVIYTSDTAFDIWYEDGTDEVKSAATTFQLKLDDEPFTVTPSANLSTDKYLNISFPTNTIAGYTAETLALLSSDFATKSDFFGTLDEKETADLTYNGAGKGSQDLDGNYFMTNYGAYFEDGDSQFDTGNKFVFSVPDQLQEATILVKSKGSVVSAGAAGSTSYSVNPISLGLGILDTDAPALGSKPMIVVGGPYANTVAAELLGNPTAEQVSETFTDGKALIRWYDDKQAMLVAGWSAQDTLGASYVVAKYDQYDLAGDEVEVVVTSLDDIKVNAVN